MQYWRYLWRYSSVCSMYHSDSGLPCRMRADGSDFPFVVIFLATLASFIWFIIKVIQSSGRRMKSLADLLCARALNSDWKTARRLKRLSLASVSKSLPVPLPAQVHQQQCIPPKLANSESVSTEANETVH